MVKLLCLVSSFFLKFHTHFNQLKVVIMRRFHHFFTSKSFWKSFNDKKLYRFRNKTRLLFLFFYYFLLRRFCHKNIINLEVSKLSFTRNSFFFVDVASISGSSLLAIGHFIRYCRSLNTFLRLEIFNFFQ